jgi:two-component system, probable response regulator PhcQ
MTTCPCPMWQPSGTPGERVVTNDIAVPQQFGGQAGQGTILFVDDDPSILAGFNNAFRREPYRILTARSGEEGLRTLAVNVVDVVVSDERMPGITGVEFLAEVREKYPNTIRMILTGHASLEVAIRAVNNGQIYRFLTKPCSSAEILIAIRQGLQLRELARESCRILAKTRHQQEVLGKLEATFPNIGGIKEDERENILLDESAIDVEQLLRELKGENR